MAIDGGQHAYVRREEDAASRVEGEWQRGS